MGQLACDDGDGVNTNGCSNSGVINSNYYCTYGTIGSADYCPPICGISPNLFTSGSAYCNDFNNLPFDGCDPNCNVEAGYTCTHTGTGADTCLEKCGDGLDFHVH